ncbi:sporulation-specific protein [Perilla frutescens var. hirtella]|nr:sporulation-specific protein [Perilla frutescens var. frutescens]KAH6787591.1 sporulation-specific protein [Perilla frutescens var. hirtella]
MRVAQTKLVLAVMKRKHLRGAEMSPFSLNPRLGDAILIAAESIHRILSLNPEKHTGWDKLFISFIHTGKPIAKTTKENVRNGSCKWGDPIYETTRLLQDSKSKQYDEKLYQLVVAMILFLSLF